MPRVGLLTGRLVIDSAAAFVAKSVNVAVPVSSVCSEEAYAKVTFPCNTLFTGTTGVVVWISVDPVPPPPVLGKGDQSGRFRH